MNKLIKLHEETQAQIDKSVAEFRVEWDKKLKESGLSELLFKTTNKDAIWMMAIYQEMKNEAESEGFTMPDFDSKTKITFHDGD